MTGQGAFYRLVNYMGQGDPSKALVFVGIEGGDGANVNKMLQTLDTADEVKVNEFYRESLLGEKLYFNPIEWEYLSSGINNSTEKISPMWRVSSKIALGVSENAQTIDWKGISNWEYRMNKYWRMAGSLTAFTNIYPIEKKTFNDKHDVTLFKVLSLPDANT